MTALVEPPGRLLTIAEYADLGEDDRYRWELQEGNFLMSPSLTPDHMLASYELCDQLKTQLPATVTVIQDVDIDLQLDSADKPGTSRRPDLVVVARPAVQRVRTEGGLRKPLPTPPSGHSRSPSTSRLSAAYWPKSRTVGRETRSRRRRPPHDRATVDPITPAGGPGHALPATAQP